MAPAARIEGRELCKNRHVLRSSPHLLLRIRIMEFFAGSGWDVGELLAVGRHCPRPTQHHGKGALPLPPYLCEIIPNTWSQGIYILDLMLKSFQIDQGHTQLTMLSVTAFCRRVSDYISCLFQHQTSGVVATTSTKFQLVHFEGYHPWVGT